MKRTQLHITGLSAIVLLIVMTFMAADTAFAAQLYTCPMHPQVIREEPGDCPICGMHLVPVPEDRAEAAPAPRKEDHAAMVPPDASGKEGMAMAMSPDSAPAAPVDAPAAPKARKIQYYKSTMMPGEVSPTPAKDSMGMDMEPVYEEAAPAEPSPQPTSELHLTPSAIQRMNLRTAPVEGGPLVREVRALGEVAYDERAFSEVSLKFDGWVERLYVNATWTKVKKGDPLFEIYSPEVYNASLNVIAARKSEGASGGPLFAAAKERLRLYGVSDEYIASLSALDAPPKTLLVRSPFSGTVVKKNIVEGRKIGAGESVLSLADLSSVWVLAQVYGQDAALVANGSKAEVRVVSGPDAVRQGVVSLVEPVTSEATRANTVRIVLPNGDESLHPGMYAEVSIKAKTRDAAVLVPEEAVLRSGEKDLVFVALGEGRFEARKVTLGARDNENRYEVTGGLRPGESVVTSGQFLLDSESNLREAVAKMLAANR